MIIPGIFIIRDISWNLNDDIKNCIKYDENNKLVDMEDHDWNRIIFNKSYGNKKLILPISYDYENNHIMCLSNDNITLQELLQKIYDFYNTIIDMDKINSIENNAYKNIAIEKYINGNKVTYIDLIGKNIHFEGLRRYEADIYQILLSSN